MTPIGLIAGSRSLPALFAREARRGGRRIVAAAFEGESDPALASVVDDILWLRVGQLGRLIRAFSERGVTECVMLGQIAPRNLFDLRPDLRAMKLLFRVRERHAHSLFGAVADELALDGITVLDPRPWLQPWMPGPDYCAGRRLSPREREDVAFGRRLAMESARLEIGQLVVVKDGTVLAVEAFEGTDACLTRGGQLAGNKGGAVAVKVAKENHDMRFDIPCLGLQTLRTCAENGVRVLAFEPHKTLLLDRPDVEELAAKLRVTVCAAPTPAPP